MVKSHLLQTSKLGSNVIALPMIWVHGIIATTAL